MQQDEACSSQRATVAFIFTRFLNVIRFNEHIPVVLQCGESSQRIQLIAS